MTERLIHTENDKDIFTLESPDKDGDLSLTVHDEDGDNTIYLNKDEVLSVIKFLTKYL